MQTKIVHQNMHFLTEIRAQPGRIYAFSVQSPKRVRLHNKHKVIFYCHHCSSIGNMICLCGMQDCARSIFYKDLIGITCILVMKISAIQLFCVAVFWLIGYLIK